MENHNYYLFKDKATSKFVGENALKQKIIQKQCLPSKILKRKPDNRLKESLKTKAQYQNPICYISPKKTLQSWMADSKDKRQRPESSICSTSNLLKDFDRNEYNFREYKRIQSVKELTKKKLEQEQELQRLKVENEILRKKLRESENKIFRLEEQNMFCLIKIEQFNKLITFKNQQITVLKYEHSKEIEEASKEVEVRELEIANLQQIIASLNKKSSISEDTDDGDCIEEYKKVNAELGSKIKYYMIQEDVHKKLRQDYEEQLMKNEKLKFMNKKMIQKISQLTLYERVRRSRLRSMDNESQNSISFELSPGK